MTTLALALVLLVTMVALKDDTGVETDLLGIEVGGVRCTTGLLLLFGGRADEGMDVLDLPNR